MKITIKEFDITYSAELDKDGVTADEAVEMIIGCLRAIHYSDESIRRALENVHL